MYLEIDFLALVFLVVYVGAIAVLFLFVIMLLNVELTQSRELKFFSIIPFTTFLMTFFFLELLILLNNYDFNLSIYNSFFFEQYSLWINNLIGHSLIETIGFILYSYFWLHLTMSALILLVAMIGAILLTLEIKKDSKYNNISVQILRSYKKKL
jgi:NADH-quinone oxidoreductase subunit J